MCSKLNSKYKIEFNLEHISSIIILITINVQVLKNKLHGVNIIFVPGFLGLGSE